MRCSASIKAQTSLFSDSSLSHQLSGLSELSELSPPLSTSTRLSGGAVPCTTASCCTSTTNRHFLHQPAETGLRTRRSQVLALSALALRRKRDIGTVRTGEADCNLNVSCGTLQTSSPSQSVLSLKHCCIGSMGQRREAVGGYMSTVRVLLRARVTFGLQRACM